MSLFGWGGKKLNLALQGGGAHGAFTWGVLDRLLEEPSINITSISGTSAGAVNGAALASGYAEGGAPGAREKLSEIWEAIGRSSQPDFQRYNPFLFGLDTMDRAAGASVKQFMKMFSPEQLNPLNIDPLRALLEAHIDFARLRRSSEVRLFIAATEAQTGRSRIFQHHELSSDVVLASACLPTIHRAVKIKGRYYWDGGFSANPDLGSLILNSNTSDTLLVLLNPMRIDDVPKSAGKIAEQMTNLTFNQPLRHEIECFLAIRDMKTGFFAKDASRQERYRRHRFHHIDGAKHTAHLAPDSKSRPDKTMLQDLFSAGRKEAGSWLAVHGDDIGRRSSVSLSALLEGEQQD